MSNISSISELLQLSDSQYRVYDIGRRIDKLSKAQFNKIEANQIPYPFPSQGHAFLAIAFWQKKSSTPYLWFVKIPLDEKGLLNQGARNHFVAIIIDALGGNLSVDPTEKQEEILKNNPYHFTPAQYKLAFLNSAISFDLKQPASQYLAQAQNYLAGDLGWENWQQIGVQGISDFVVRLSASTQQKILTHAFANLPEQVLIPLCSALENITLSVDIIECIIDRYEQSPDTNTDVKAALLRSLSASCQHSHVNHFINQLIAEGQLPEQLVIVIAGRCWQALDDEEHSLAFLELLAESQTPDVFQAIFKDLVAIPTIRPLLLQNIRSTKRSNELAQAIGLLFKR